MKEVTVGDLAADSISCDAVYISTGISSVSDIEKKHPHSHMHW